MERKVRIAIIGAGTSGLTALGVVRKVTDDFVIINDGPYGTTCARVGCMPSKALIQAANDFHRRHVLDELGIRGAAGLTVDVPAVLRRVRAVRDQLVSRVLLATARLGDRSIAGRARFEAPTRLRVGEQIIEAQAVIIATGSRPVIPEPWRAFGARLLTSDNLFEQTDLPRRIAVVGLGVIGVELGQALARLGLVVEGFDLRDTVAGFTDPVLRDFAVASLGGEFPLHLGAPVAITGTSAGLNVTAGEHTMAADAVLAAMGRRPNLDGMGLEHLGVSLDAQGMPPWDPATAQVADLPVYLAGDATGSRAVLHEASDEGFIAAHGALAGSARSHRRRTPLAIAFCEPNAALVGATWAELQGRAIHVGETDFADQSRALVALRNHGRLRVYADAASERLLGAELMAPAGEHLAHLLALAVQRGLRVRDLLQMPVYHPVLEEGLRAALRGLAHHFDDPAAAVELVPSP